MSHSARVLGSPLQSLRHSIQFNFIAPSFNMSTDDMKQLLHSVVLETLTEKLPHDGVLALIKSGCNASAQDRDGLSPAELALSLEPEGTLASAMVLAECERLAPVEALKMVIARGNLFLVQVLVRNSENVTLESLELAFAELKTRNVRLSTDVIDWIYYQLVEAEYRRGTCGTMIAAERDVRIAHLIGCIEFLEENYGASGEFNDMEDMFVLYLRQILEHVFLLKNYLKELPLMQLQFCLATFLKLITGMANENDDIYVFLLDKEIILDFLTTTKSVINHIDATRKLIPEEYFLCLRRGKLSNQRFSSRIICSIQNELKNNPELQKLAKVDSFVSISSTQLNLLNSFCDKLNKQLRNRYIQKHFKPLLQTYHTARSHYSICKMISTIDTIRNLDLSDHSPTLPTSIAALKRSLQVIGETIKSSRQTPNITKKLDGILQVFSSQSFVQLTKDLRQFFSHDYSLAKERLEEECPVEVFQKILENLVQCSDWLDYTLFLLKVYLFQRYLARLYRLEGIERIRSYTRFVGTEFVARLQSSYVPREINEAILMVENLLASEIPARSKVRLENAHKLLTIHRNALQNDITSVGQLIDEYFFLGKYILQEASTENRVKAIVKAILQSSSKNLRYKSVDKSVIRSVSNVIMELRLGETDQGRIVILEEIWRRVVKGNVFGIESLRHRTVVEEEQGMEETMTILNELGISRVDSGFVEMVDRRLRNKYYRNLFDLDNKYRVLSEVIKDDRVRKNFRELKVKLKRMRAVDEGRYQMKFDRLKASIERIVARYGSVSSIVSMQLTPVDRLALEYHLLEVCEILCSLKVFPDNTCCLKKSIPIISGRNIRNYLAHDQLGYNVLTNASAIIETNALYLLRNDINLYRRSSPQISDCDHTNFPDLFATKLKWTTRQKEVFDAIKAFDVKTLTNTLSTDPTLFLGRTHLDRDPLSIALNSQPDLFINQLLNSSDDHNFLRFFTSTSTDFTLKQQLKHMLRTPHRFCYSIALQFELTSDLQRLRTHPSVDPTLQTEPLIKIFSDYSNSSLHLLLTTFPAEQFLRDQRLQNTVLHWTALRGDPDLVRHALGRHRTLIDEINAFGETAIALAVRFGHAEVVQLLIEGGADVHLGKCSPAWIAACLGDIRMVDLLRVNGGEISGDRRNPLIAALEHDHFEVFVRLHGLGFGMEGEDLMHKAIQLGRSRFLRYMLDSRECGQLIDAVDAVGFTPAMTAATCGRIQIFNLILEGGPNLDFVSEFGYTVLHCAAYSGDLRIMDILLQRTNVDIDVICVDNISPLSLAISQNDTKLLSYLLSKGAKVTTHHLIQAGYYKNYDIVSQLLDRDPSLLDTTRDISGRSLLMYAVIDCNLPAVEDLLLRGSNVNIQATGNFTALHIATSRNDLKICDRLIKAGASLETVDHEGRTALDIAVLYEFISLAKHLLSLGSNPDSVRNFRFSASRNATFLHKFAHENRISVVRFLLDRIGFDVSLTDDRGETALDYARERGNYAIVELLSNPGTLL